jgi:hypothetical protein
LSLDEILEMGRAFRERLEQTQKEIDAAVPAELRKALDEMLAAGVPRQSIRLVTAPANSLGAALLAQALNLRLEVHEWVSPEAAYLVDWRQMEVKF